jgi:hypothetical protein
VSPLLIQVFSILLAQEHQVQCLLAFSASSQYYHRFNSESSAILACSTLIQRLWQLLPQKYRETERRNLPFSGSNRPVSAILTKR